MLNCFKTVQVDTLCIPSADEADEYVGLSIYVFARKKVFFQNKCLLVNRLMKVHNKTAYSVVSMNYFDTRQIFGIACKLGAFCIH